MKIEWLPRAEEDLDSQLDYVADRNPWAAVDIGDVIEAAMQRLAAHPQIGRPGRIKGTRELVISDARLMIAYRIEPGKVVILRLLHGAQRWPRRL